MGRATLMGLVMLLVSGCAAWDPAEQEESFLIVNDCKYSIVNFDMAYCKVYLKEKP